ncbi:MAG: hypothetical protein NW241_06580 [Bacteroidia bacterium]|nr:hypothetical protein [Bacteroidia bacterium]
MNAIKRALGAIWMLLGPAAVYFMISQAATKIGAAGDRVAAAADEAARAAASAAKLNLQLQWGIIIAIFLPIAFGVVIFGYYAIRGEYDHLPESSAELE